MAVDLARDDGLLKLRKIEEAQLLDASRVLLVKISQRLQQVLGVDLGWVLCLHFHVHRFVGINDLWRVRELLERRVVELSRANLPQANAVCDETVAAAAMRDRLLAVPIVRLANGANLLIYEVGRANALLVRNVLLVLLACPLGVFVVLVVNLRRHDRLGQLLAGALALELLEQLAHVRVCGDVTLLGQKFANELLDLCRLLLQGLDFLCALGRLEALLELLVLLEVADDVDELAVLAKLLWNGLLVLVTVEYRLLTLHGGI